MTDVPRRDSSLVGALLAAPRTPDRVDDVGHRTHKLRLWATQEEERCGRLVRASEPTRLWWAPDTQPRRPLLSLMLGQEGR